MSSALLSPSPSPSLSSSSWPSSSAASSTRASLLPSTEAATSAARAVSLSSPSSPTIPLLSPPPGSSLWSPLDVLRSYCIRGVPGWSHLTPQQIHLTQLKKGMTNQLFIAERAGGAAGAAAPASRAGAAAAVDAVAAAGGGFGVSLEVFERVVVRVFGADTSTFFDREYEEYITRRLSKRGVGSRILTEFGTGRIEEFLEGRTLDCDDLSDPRISFLAAKALATLHSKHIPITAQLIDNAKKKVQRDARKLLPLHAALNLTSHQHNPHPSGIQHWGKNPRLAKVDEDGGVGVELLDVASSTSPPSSPSRSLSSLSSSEVASASASASASQPTSPLHPPVSIAAAFAPPPLLSSSARGSGVSEFEHSHEPDSGSADGVGYQEPLLYFRIHHWFQVARRLDFPEYSAELDAGEQDGGRHAGGAALQTELQALHLTPPACASEGSASSKRRLFLSLRLDSPEVETEEQWLLAKLQSLHSPIVFCLSEDTEVLTDRGFMSRAEVFTACPELAPSSPTAAPASDSAALPFGGAVHTRTTDPFHWTLSPAEEKADAAAGISCEQLASGATTAVQLRDSAGRYGRRCGLCRKSVWSTVKKGAYTLMHKHTRSAHPAEVAQAARAVAPRTGRVSVTSAASAFSTSRFEPEEGEEDEKVSQPGSRAAPPAPSTPLRFASLDPSTGHLVYLPATALVWKTAASLVEFTDAAEAPSWAEDADEYGLTPDQVQRIEARSARARAGEHLEKEAHFHAECRSNGVSLRVDRQHDMYARVGMADCTQISWADDYVKVKAGSLVSDDLRQRVRMTGQATAGFDASAISDDELPFVAALGLSTTAQIDAFLWMYGYWLGDGCLDVQQRAVAFSPKKGHDKKEVKERLESLGFTVPSLAVRVYDASNGQLVFRVTDRRWADYFFGEYSPKYGIASVSSSRPHTHTGLTTPLPKSVKWFWMWVWRLRKARARLVLAGLRYADGDEATDVNRISTSGVAFRDDLVRLALHAGYAARFDVHYKAGDHRGYGEEDDPYEANHDHWSVSYSDWPAAVEPVLHNHCDIKEVEEPTGTPVPVWCVTVPPHHLIIARRVRHNDEGVVTLASKPLVVGNCHNDLQEGNLILEEKQPRAERRRRKTKKSQPPDSSATPPVQPPTSHLSHPPSNSEEVRSVVSSLHRAVPSVYRERALSLPSSAPPAVAVTVHPQAALNGSEAAALSPRQAQQHKAPHSSNASLVIDVTGQRDFPSASISRWPPPAQASVDSDISFDTLTLLMTSPASPTSPELHHHRPLRNHRTTITATSSTTTSSSSTPTQSPSSAGRALTSSHSPPPSSSSSPYSGWRLHMIDFEYSSYNPRGFDLGNHACEHYIDYAHSDWPGFIIKPQRFPSDLHLSRFLRVYLTHFRHVTKRPAPVTDDEVAALLEETLWFTLASHFKWAMWAVVQAKRSEIHFGYMEYAVQRMQQYYAYKERLTRRFAHSTTPPSTTATTHSTASGG